MTLVAQAYCGVVFPFCFLSSTPLTVRSSKIDPQKVLSVIREAESAVVFLCSPDYLTASLLSRNLAVCAQILAGT